MTSIPGFHAPFMAADRLSRLVLVRWMQCVPLSWWTQTLYCDTVHVLYNFYMHFCSYTEFFFFRSISVLAMSCPGCRAVPSHAPP